MGSVIIAFTNAISSSLAIFVITMFGRRTIYIFGALGMAAGLGMAGLCLLLDWNMTAFVMICLFIVVYRCSTGSVAWLYIPEITVDAASGFAASGMFLPLAIIAFTFEFMINSPLKVYGSIWIFAGFNLVSFVFCYMFVRETRGLNDL